MSNDVTIRDIIARYEEDLPRAGQPGIATLCPSHGWNPFCISYGLFNSQKLAEYFMMKLVMGK